MAFLVWLMDGYTQKVELVRPTNFIRLRILSLEIIKNLTSKQLHELEKKCIFSTIVIFLLPLIRSSIFVV